MKKEHTAFSALLIAALLVHGWVGCGRGDDGTTNGPRGELDLAIDSDPAAPFFSYLVSIVALGDGETIVERTVPVPQMSSMPRRFTAALPAGVPLLLDVVALDADGNEVGSGAAVVSLPPQQLTTVEIVVVAQPSGAPGIVDGRVIRGLLPHREYLLPDPAENLPGETQTLVAKLIEVESNTPVSNAVALEIDSIVGPMYLEEQDGGLTTSWVWPEFQSFPIEAAAKIAYVDSAGRGFVARAVATFGSAEQSVPIAYDWSGQIRASGLLANQGAWYLGLEEPSQAAQIPCNFILYSDVNADGDFDDQGEILELAHDPEGRIVFWTAPQPVEVLGASDIAGALVDEDGDGFLDVLVALSLDGAISVASWPPGS